MILQGTTAEDPFDPTAEWLEYVLLLFERDVCLHFWNGLCGWIGRDVLHGLEWAGYGRGWGGNLSPSSAPAINAPPSSDCG